MGSFSLGTASNRVFQSLQGWSCLDVTDGSAAKESCPDRKSPEACRCLRPFSKNACGVLSGWSTTNVVTQERISFVPNLRMTGGPTEDGAAKT